jgi:nucleoside-diphosphate-sugar epimerase
MSSTSKVALVTGANGFVGSNLCEVLLARGYRVKAFMRQGSKDENLKDVGAEVVHGQISEAESFEKAVKDVDTVFHVAGIVRERKRGDFMRVNAEAAGVVAKTCASRKGGPPRLVLISSQAAAGPAPSLDRPTAEDDEPRPISEYGRSKLAGEAAMRAFAHELPLSIVRPPTVYGPRDTDFYDVFKMAQRGVVLKPGFNTKLYNVVHAVDLAEASVLVSESGEYIREPSGGVGVYFAHDGGTYAWEELAAATATALGKSARVLPLPGFLTYGVAAAMTVGSWVTGEPPIVNFDKVPEILGSTWVCSARKLHDDLGFRPRYPIATGLAHTAEWYRSRGLLPAAP